MTDILPPKLASITQPLPDRLEITLTGDPQTLLNAYEKLDAEKTAGGLSLVDIGMPDDATDSLTISATLTPDDSTDKFPRMDTVEKIHDITHCHLGNVLLKSCAVPVNNVQKKPLYSAAFTVTVMKDEKDKSNRLGAYSLEIMRRQCSNYVCDPRFDKQHATRLMRVDKEYSTEKEAEFHAEQMVTDARTKFGLPMPQPLSVRLLSVKTGHVQTRKGIVHTAVARMEGSRQMIEKAVKALERVFPNLQWEQKHAGVAELTITSLTPIDAPGFLGRLHKHTGCALPLDIVPDTVVEGTGDAPFRPCLETRVTSDNITPDEHLHTRMALLRYAATYVPGSRLDVPEHRLVFAELTKAHPRVVVNRPFSSREKAKEVADRITVSVNSHIHGNKDRER